MKQEKDILFSQSANLFKTLSSPARLKLVNFISYCPRTVEECSQKFEQSVQNISLHLRALLKADVLEVEKVKNYRVYSLKKTPILSVLYHEGATDGKWTLPKELTCDLSLSKIAELVLKDKATVIDLRSPQEAAYIDLKKALPFDYETESYQKLLKDLPMNKDILVVCRGRWCERMTNTVIELSRLRDRVYGLGLTAPELEQLNELMEKS